MFRSITSAGRTALRTGAFSRQATAVNQQPSIFNALRAFSDDAAGRTKGTVKWFGTSVVVFSVSDMYSSRSCWFTARPRSSLSWSQLMWCGRFFRFISVSGRRALHLCGNYSFHLFDPAPTPSRFLVYQACAGSYYLHFYLTI